MKKEQLIAEFNRIGISNGDILEVHSSLSSFGHVEGGAETVIEALMECVGEDGTIFMPALRLSPELELTENDMKLGVTVKIKILSENAPRTAMGVIADTFRQRRDVVTGDGIFRISGWGKYADEAVKGGLDYAIHNGGKALLLGVDIYKLTAMHYIENCLPEKIKNAFAPNEEVCKIYPSDEWFIEMGEPPVKPWYTIQNIAYSKGYIDDGYIGKCKYMLFDIFSVIDLYKQELENNPFNLYGME